MFNIISFGKKKENLLIAIRQGVIGSTLTTFQDKIKPNSTIFLHCDKKIWATAQIQDDYFFSEEIIWKDKIYPQRFKIHNCKMLKTAIELNDGVINAEFRKISGPSWAYRYLFSPKEIPNNIANLILEKISNVETVSFEDFKKIIEHKNK